MKILASLQQKVDAFQSEFDRIDPFRKSPIEYMARELAKQYSKGNSLDLMFVCTHNSRRSILSQIWAQTAAYYFEIKNVNCFSGGTVETTFYQSALTIIEQTGFKVTNSSLAIETNPRYQVYYSLYEKPISVFSKIYTTSPNPKSNFVAIVNCSKADESCPVVAGANSRMLLLYQDPKRFDGYANEMTHYQQTSDTIGTELFYLFSLFKVELEQEGISFSYQEFLPLNS